MKRMKLLLAVICSIVLAGCGSVSEKVDEMLKNNSNIGMNKPAVGASISDIDLPDEDLNNNMQEGSNTDAADDDQKSNELIRRADEILLSMSTEEKIGQLILAKLPDDPVREMEKYALGGYTLYANDFSSKTAEDIALLTEEICSAAVIAPFIAVDEEGGTVVRVSKFTEFRDEPFSSPQLLYSRGGIELLEIDGEEKARLLTSMGINFNLAPVADISTDKSSYIYPRTLGQNAEDTAQGIAAIVRTANENDLASCLKHFPGYGENTDTHTGTAHDSRELYEFYNRDFVPFEAGINASEDKTPAIMVGHTIYDNIDENIPASLSSVIIGVLREKLNFDGVVITDDLGMDAIQGFESDLSVYVMALLAGNDMLCVSDHIEAYEAIKAAYDEGIVTDEILDEHITRILIMKLSYGIIR